MMGKLFIPMSTTHPHHSHSGRPQRGCPVSVYQPSLLDAIISGVLRQLQVEESAANQGGKQTMGKRTRLPWVHTVNMKGFQPRDISVKVEDHTVHIAAKHLTETAAGRDVIERYRQVQLPEDVDVEKLNCFLDESGKLIMKAPVAVCHQSKKCMETSNVECCRNTPNIKMNRQGEEKSEKRDNEDNEDLPSKHRDGTQAGYHPTDPEHTNDGNQAGYHPTDTEHTNDGNQAGYHPTDPEHTNDGNQAGYHPTETEHTNDGNQAGYHPTDPEHTNDGNQADNHDEQTNDNPQDERPREVDVGDLNKSDTVLTCQRKVKNDNDRKDEENDLLTVTDCNIIKGDELTSEQSFGVVEDHFSPPNSPQESIEFLILDKDGEETPTIVKTPTVVKTTTDVKPSTIDETVELTTDNTLDIQHLDTSETHPILDSTRVRDIDGRKQFEITINLKHYKPENTSIRYKDGCLRIDAEKEVETDSLTTYQKVHREFTLPKQGLMEAAQASMNNEGLLRVIMPLHMDN